MGFFVLKIELCARKKERNLEGAGDVGLIINEALKTIRRILEPVIETMLISLKDFYDSI